MNLLRSTFLLLVLFASAGILKTQMSGPGPTPRGVEGNPFSADVINQHSKVLADGNRIEQETHGKMYRDSQGRVRSEIEMLVTNGEHRQNISIRDQTQRVSITLDPVRKTAHVFHMPDPATMRKEMGQQPQPPQPSQISHKTEQLGNMTIEGFNATGTRFTNTTAANAIGNAEPLVSMNEMWWSPDLQVQLMTKSADPQYGKTCTSSSISSGLNPTRRCFRFRLTTKLPILRRPINPST